MLVGIGEVEIYVYQADSLKEKRMVLKSLIERIKSRYNVSIAEVDHNDKWNRALIGFSYVSNDSRKIESNMAAVLNFIENDCRVEIVYDNIEIV